MLWFQPGGVTPSAAETLSKEGEQAQGRSDQPACRAVAQKAPVKKTRERLQRSAGVRAPCLLDASPGVGVGDHRHAGFSDRRRSCGRPYTAPAGSRLGRVAVVGRGQRWGSIEGGGTVDSREVASSLPRSCSQSPRSQLPAKREVKRHYHRHLSR
jgi:hypothetical protein